MDSPEHEIEFVFEWTGQPIVIDTIEELRDWKTTVTDYLIVDSIYDTPVLDLASQKAGARLRTKADKTTLTIKKFLGKGENNESLYDEYHKKFESNIHPQTLTVPGVAFVKINLPLEKRYQFNNQRHQIEFTHGTKLVRLINETVTYSDSSNIVTDHLIEVELEGITDSNLISTIKEGLISKYKLSQINEGKTDRAMRMLEQPKGKVLIQNVKDIKKQTMHAHGGKGLIDMWFFHQPYSRFEDKENVPVKAFDYESVNWDFFAYAELPVGAEVKNHLHDKTDEIYFVIDGGATIMVDDVSQKIGKGDCILTRKGSSHSLSSVTATLKFIAFEVHR